MKTKTILTLLVALFTSSAFASLSLSPNGTFAECPDEWITYTVTNTYPDGCGYNWTVTNGEIQGGSTTGNTSTFTGGNIVHIKWLNTTTSGSISVSAQNCNNANGNSSQNKTIPILSINGVTPSSITGSSSVAANITTNKVYEVTQINFPNIGSGDVSPYEVSDYEWQLPTGWTVVELGENIKKGEKRLNLYKI